MRGKGDADSIAVFLCRITPAYAGKSNYDVAKINDGGDHPRLCGEKNHHFCRYGLSEGSPPPMRGKDVVTISFSPICRITPAYAGKRKERTGSITQSMDHPRLCGEKIRRHLLY